MVAADGQASAGTPITVGIRPEHLHPVGERDAMVAGEVQMVEQLGADTLAHIAHGSDIIVARLPHGGHADVGATLHLGADPARVFLFDSTSGARLQ